MAYCTVADLLIGDIRQSAALDPEKYVNDAADEIDSKIGWVYQTPIPVETNTPTGSPAAATPRPVQLLLKRINAHLASGRMILAATVAAEQDQLNAYGASLVAEAELAIGQIASGQLVLDGVTAGTGSTPSKPRPLIANGDSESYVDAFYNRVVNPEANTLRFLGY